MVPYKHSEDLHNSDAPQKIVPYIMDLIKPESVIDVGCGLGNFLKVFKDLGVKEILGIDGEWCNKELLFKSINQSDFLVRDLNNRIFLEKRFDLVVCLEVGEHLSPDRSDSFVEDLTNLGDVILFSAAIPDQWGTNHINEQWISYWEKKFNNHDYQLHDILKTVFWEEKDVFWWYSQNMVLIAKNGFKFKSDFHLNTNHLKKVVHPELFRSRNEYLNKITSGASPLKYYIKLLVKAILLRLRLRN